MIQAEATLHKTKVIPEKRTAKDDLKAPKYAEFTVRIEYDDLTAAEFANLALAQAHEDVVDVTFNPRQLVMNLHNTVTPADDA